MALAERRPVGLEVELAVGMSEPVQEMHVLEGFGAIDPARFMHAPRIGQPRGPKRRIDHLPRRHLETWMLGAETFCQGAKDVVVRAALADRLDDLPGDLQKSVAAGDIDVVMFEERRCRQDDVGHRRRLGQELFVDADEQIVAHEAVPHGIAVGANHDRVGVLDEQRFDRRAVAEIGFVAVQDRADARLIEQAGRFVARIEALDQGLIKPVKPAVRVESAAALMPPGAGNRWNAGHGEEVGGAVARA